MSMYSRRRSGSPIAFQSSGPFSRSMAAAPFKTSSSSSSSFASSSSCYSSSSAVGFFSQRRSISPPRVNLHALMSPSPTPSVRFSIDRSTSPRRTIAASPPSRSQVVRRPGGSIQKKTCLCSPTTHPGSFRCSLHKNSYCGSGGGGNQSLPYSSNRLNMRRSAMTNSLVRIGTVEGDLVKRALAALIRPSSHQQRRRVDFQPRPSRLSVMSKANDSNH